MDSTQRVQGPWGRRDCDGGARDIRGDRVSVPAAASRPDHAYARGGHADEGSDSACSWERESLILTFRRTDVGVKLIWWFATVNTREDTVVDGHDLPRMFAQESCLPHLDPQGSCRSSHLRRCGRMMLGVATQWTVSLASSLRVHFAPWCYFKLPPGSRRLVNARRTLISPCEVR